MTENDTQENSVLRWIAVLPGVVASLFLTRLLLRVIIYREAFAAAPGEPIIQNEVSLLALIHPQVLEFFGMAFLAPLVAMSAGAWIAPKYKFQSAILLAVGLIVLYGFLAAQVVGDINSGYYTAGGWLRLAITVALIALGFFVGQYSARRIAAAH